MNRARIPVVELARQHANLAEELQAAFTDVVSSSAFVLGEHAERFEHNFARYCGVRHCVGVGSGSAALTIALLAAGIGPGDEVIIPAHTFVATALAVVQAQATVVFCDVQKDTGLIDPEAVAAAITSKTAAIVPVHLYGNPCDMESIASLARSHGLFVLEDAAQAHGASYKGRRVGCLGDAAAFSFYPSKNLGALGDAGAICTNSADLARQARALRDIDQTSEHDLCGLLLHERLDGLQAAMLRIKLGYLDESNLRRQAHADRYRESLAGEVELVTQTPGATCVYHVFPVRVHRRAAVQAKLAERGVQTRIHYPATACDRLRAAGRCTQNGLEYPVARSWVARELSLPMFAELRAEEVEATIEAVNQCL